MKFPKFLLALIVLLIVPSCSSAPIRWEPTQETGSSNQQDVQPTTGPTTEPTSAPNESVPEIDNSSSRPSMMFGLESHSMSFADYPEFFGETGMQLVRHNGLVWPSVEPVEGDRQWQMVADLDEKLAKASASGLTAILIVRGTPEWAQMIPGSSCGPIKPEKIESFATFMSEAVSRYSAPPYNIKFWEMGNEPDVDPSLIPQNSPFGCWGDLNDPYYGGGYYAEMLKVVYPAIKNADPEAKILIGGLLLDCDPTHTPEGKDCTPGKFLEGILVNGGGDFFDMVSFHGYVQYIGPDSELPTRLFFDDHNPSWGHRGGVVIGKVDFLREVMSTYNFDKPIFHTEGALLCPEQNPTDCDPPDEGFFDSQADYAIRMYVRNWANSVSGTIWYQLEGPGWRYGGLLDENQMPKPVFQAIDFLTTQLSNVDYRTKVEQFGSLEGYEFISPETKIWILWSLEEVDTQIQLPVNTIAVMDKFGNLLAPDGNQITVNSPIYVLLPVE